MCLEKYTAKFQGLSTPFYFYDVQLLNDTINTLKQASDKYKYHIHYSLKANSNPKILELLKDNGFGADCVSGNEIKLAINTGFSKDSIVFAGVGKTDAEIEIALQNDIFCFNCESMDEIFVINELALKNKKVASIALRINPAVDAHTHKHINTGVDTSKFGIEKEDISMVCDNIKLLNNINLIGLHVHIGSQIT
ncbi:MAG: diaminopimelate decarboxylase, partial [Bacteroidota bacterium]